LLINKLPRSNIIPFSILSLEKTWANKTSARSLAVSVLFIGINKAYLINRSIVTRTLFRLLLFQIWDFGNFTIKFIEISFHGSFGIGKDANTP
jgi:hypothetical protein